jgi:hypothetical protein|tara:strand:+ start:150 stop:503 length:354 start_codon:yes stop_codon:yes gene_type:complete
MLKPIFKTFVITFLITLSTSANAIILSYVTGNDYLALSERDQDLWFVGVLDGTMSEGNIIEKDPMGNWLSKCASNTPIPQFKAIYEKELRNNPDGWHAPAAFIVRGSLRSYCMDKKF